MENLQNTPPTATATNRMFRNAEVIEHKSGLTLFGYCNAGKMGGQLQANQIAFHAISGKKHTLTLNKTLSRQLKNRGFRYVAIGQSDYTGQIFLVFSADERGVKISHSGEDNDNPTYTINNKRMITDLCEIFNVSAISTSKILTVSENVSKREDAIVLEMQSIK